MLLIICGLSGFSNWTDEMVSYADNKYFFGT